LVGTFPGYPQNSFKKQQLVVCRFSKEFCANPRNVSTNRKTGVALCHLKKSFENSNGLD
jgi:hypothetical protein